MDKRRAKVVKGKGPDGEVIAAKLTTKAGRFKLWQDAPGELSVSLDGEEVKIKGTWCVVRYGSGPHELLGYNSDPDA